jgi:Tfp pilus assembly protein PilW
VNSRTYRPAAAFTLVELLVGMSLALVVMTAVLSSYTFLGRSLFRLLNQQTLQTEARRTLQYFQQDVRMASGISSTPSSSSLILVLPTANNSTTTITWVYDSSARTLTRTPASGTALVLLSNATSSTFAYYDSTGNAFTGATLSARSYLPSIKQISLNFTSQTGANSDGSRSPQTADYQVSSPRVTLRNQAFLQ